MNGGDRKGHIGNGNMETLNHFQLTTGQQTFKGKKIREKERGTGRLRIQRILHANRCSHHKTHPPFTNQTQNQSYIFPKIATIFSPIYRPLIHHIFSPLAKTRTCRDSDILGGMKN